MAIRAPVTHRLLTTRPIISVSRRLFSNEGETEILPEGESEANRILADGEREANRILAEGEREANRILAEAMKVKGCQAAVDYMRARNNLKAFDKMLESTNVLVISSDPSKSLLAIVEKKPVAGEPMADRKETLSQIINDFLRGPEDLASTTKLVSGLSNILRDAQASGADPVVKEEAMMEEVVKDMLKEEAMMEEIVKDVLKGEAAMEDVLKDVLKVEGVMKKSFVKGKDVLKGVVMDYIKEIPTVIGKDILTMVLGDVMKDAAGVTELVFVVCKILAIVKKAYHLALKKASTPRFHPLERDMEDLLLKRSL